MNRSGASRGLVITLVVAGINALLLLLLVAMSLSREPPPEFAPTPLDRPPPPANGTTPIRVTLDVRAPDRWVFFSFARGTVVAGTGGDPWDIAFRRFEVMVNDSGGGVGRGTVAEMGDVDLESVRMAPRRGYRAARASADSTHPALRDWYDYSYLAHTLTPKPGVYAIRTADGKHALLRFVGYYCPGASSGCVTFEYRYPVAAE
jgi:hypothetical protein